MARAQSTYRGARRNAAKQQKLIWRKLPRTNARRGSPMVLVSR